MDANQQNAPPNQTPQMFQQPQQPPQLHLASTPPQQQPSPPPAAQQQQPFGTTPIPYPRGGSQEQAEAPTNSNDVVPPSMLTNNAAVVAALLGKCDFPKKKMLMEYTQEINRRGHRLENQQYYVGMLSGSDVASYLKKVGDFGVHACDQHGGQVRLMLTVRGSNGVYHMDLIFDAKGRGWNFYPTPSKSKFHKTVIDLVEYHKSVPIPSLPEKVCLIDSLTRPSWFLKHDNVTFEKSDLLGKGNFCEVYRGKLNRQKVIAVKVCHANWRYTDANVQLNTKEKEARDGLIQEGSVMSRMRHPNVITFYGICCDHPPIMIALEICPGDSLLRHLVNLKGAISIGERIKFLVEAADGMAFLQKNGLVHCDLAARNCLISKYGKVKIADFGLSKLVSQLSGESWNNSHIPVRWMAPETLRHNPDYSSKSDVWAYGILTYEVFSYGEKPWPDWENKKIATYIRRGQMMELPAYTPPQIKSLVAEIWKIQPAERPDFNVIAKKVTEIQAVFPAPRPQLCTISRIKGVTMLSAQEIEVLEENSADIQIEAAVSSISAPQEMPIMDGKMPTVDEADIPTAQLPVKKAKKKSSKNANRTREQTHDHDQAANNNNLSKPAKKQQQRGEKKKVNNKTMDQTLDGTMEDDGFSNNTAENDDTNTPQQDKNGVAMVEKSAAKNRGDKQRRQRQTQREGGAAAAGGGSGARNKGDHQKKNKRSKAKP